MTMARDSNCSTAPTPTADRGRGGRGGRGKGGGRGRGRGGGRGGRAGRGGRTSNSNNNSNNNSNSNSKLATAKPKSSTTKQVILKNGDKGADAHTVSEGERIKFTKILMELRESNDDTTANKKLEFPATLTNTERKFIHELAARLGLVSKSTGKGDKRRIIVSKRSGDVKKATATDQNGDPTIPNLSIGRQGNQALQKHLRKFPLNQIEELESKETGSSLLHAFATAEKQQQTKPGTAKNNNNSNNDNVKKTDADDAGDDIMISEALNQLGLGSMEAATIIQPKERYVDLTKRAAKHKSFQNQKLATNNRQRYQSSCNRRSQLPAYALERHVVDTVKSNPVSIIQGETGCGKSTQVPQFILDANPTSNIVVTQPRRISAISIAERVLQEQCLDESEGIGGLIGYQVRLDSQTTKDVTQLAFLTPGILLRKLQSSPTLSEYTHIIIDEVHERDKYTDFLLITLRDLLPRRPDLRLVLMSATLQVDVLINYFGGGNDDHLDSNNNANIAIHDFYKANPPAIIEIEGRTYPVQEFFLEHILGMTNYIHVDDNDIEKMKNGGCDDNGGGDNNSNNNNNDDAVMTMEELDAQLAKLLGPSEATITIGADATMTKGPPKLTCVMCGGKFHDHVELGLHVAICTGSAGIDAYDQTMPADNDDDDDNNYEEYDLNGTAQVCGYEFQIPDNDAFEEEDPNIPKWDGTGLFQEDYIVEADISPKQDVMLNKYQTMHDDEQVDTSLLIEILHYIIKSSHGEGAILVFLSGWQEISELQMELECTVPFNKKSKYSILPLHSGIPSSDQRRVLQRPKPGVRKIVLSTNIAETSLTIEDVAFVVDSGRAKEKSYDPHLKTSTLQPTWVSKASSKQRKGRAGRTKAGVCFHMFSSRRYNNMRQFRESELLRTPLEEMCLLSKKLGLAPGGSEDPDGIPAFLSKAISPPHEKSVSNALDLLIDLGALLPETNDLTDLGKCLSVLSLEPRVGKMVIWSYLLGCTRVAAQMAVAMSYKSPFTLPPPSLRRDAEKAQVELSQGSESDQVTVFNAAQKYDQLKKRGAHYNFCRRSFINAATMQMVSDLKQNLKRELSSLGFADPLRSNEYHNRYDRQHALWQGAIAAGLYPNVATRKRGEVNFSTMTNQKCKIQNGSVNAIKGQPLNAKSQVPEGEVEFLCFGEMVKGNRLFMCSQTTHLASCLPILLLCGTSLSVHPYATTEAFAVLNLDDWIVFKCDAQAAAGIVVLRKRLDSAFRNVVKDPALYPANLSPLEKDAIETLGQVLISGLKSSNVR